jgi:type IV secretion system protein VirB9
MRRIVLVLLLMAPWSAVAQTMPSPSLDDPRLQTLVYDPARPARLVAFAGANLTLMLMPGDQIEKVTTSDRNAFDVRITESNDSLNIMPLRPDAAATLVVDTKQRRYEFDVGTKGGLAAYLVRLVQAGPAMPMPGPMPMRPPGAPPLAPIGTNYKLSGDRSLLPAAMSDDGRRTYIQWGEYQSLPAVFGIGPTGQEEVVDGYVRDGKFTIDRVYGQIVFRIDKRQAIARRLGKKVG